MSQYYPLLGILIFHYIIPCPPLVSSQAIMFTDIVGYTSLMGRDSDKALNLVRISKEIQKPLVNANSVNSFLLVQ